MNRLRHAPGAIRGLGVVLLTLALASSARADLMTRHRPESPPLRPATFDLSGVYGGVLGGAIVIDGSTYMLNPVPQVFRIGTGPISLIDLEIGTRVYISGTVGPDGGQVRAVIARPAGEHGDQRGSSSAIRVRDPSSPQ